jgi:hypothetical protein
MQVTNIQARNDRRNRKLRPVQKRTSKAEDCPLFDLCGKRILIVGGITKIKTFYRRAIEKKGAVFEYHDGWGKHGLEGKKYCKRVQMLPSSSLSSISQALSKSARTS